MEGTENFIEKLPGDVVVNCLMPFLQLYELQALDTACTRDLRTYLRRLPKFYDCIDTIIDGDDDLDWLESFGAQIRGVNLRHGEMIHSLPENVYLKRLAMEKDIDEDMILLLTEKFPNLEILRLGHGIYSGIGIYFVADKCHQLHTISWGGRHTTDIATEDLSRNCKHLRHIECRHENLTDESLKWIAKTYPHLQSLSITGWFTTAGIQELVGKCRELKSVALRRCRSIRSNGFRALWEANPNLTDVTITRSCFLSDDDITVLIQCCDQLERLNLRKCENITNAAVIAVAERYPQLISLNISYCSVSDDALIALGQHCHGLKTIDISHADYISDVGILALAAGCPLLQEFASTYPHITSDAVIALARGCRNLRKVEIRNCRSIGVKTISAIVENCHYVSELSFSDCKKVNNACLRIIAQHCRYLTKLDVDDTSVYKGSALLTVIKSCHMLKQLRFSHLQLKEKYKTYLRKMQRCLYN